MALVLEVARVSVIIMIYPQIEILEQVLVGVLVEVEVAELFLL